MITSGAIEDGIPVQGRAYRRRPTTFGVLRQLQPGQSVLIETDSGPSLRSAVVYLRRRYGYAMTVRKLAANGKLESFRVWRLENPALEGESGEGPLAVEDGDAFGREA